MTAHSEITGTRVLVAPEHIRGPIHRTGCEKRKRARAAWIASLPASVTCQEAADALGIARTPAGRLLRKYRPVDPATRRGGARLRVWENGLAFGSVMRAVETCPAPAQEALEIHCARTGQTIAEALVELWATVHGEERA